MDEPTCDWGCRTWVAVPGGGEYQGVHVDCTVHNETRFDELDQSFKKDGMRWYEGYVQQSTESVRRRVLAVQNGHR